MCAVFVSSFSSLTPFVSVRLRSSPFVSVRRPLAAGACRFPFRLVPLLACSSRGASRGYSLRLASRLVLSRQFARRSAAPSRQAARPSVSLSVLRCLVLPGSSFLISLLRLALASRQAVRILVPPRRFVSAARILSVPLLRSFLFSFLCFARCVSWT